MRFLPFFILAFPLLFSLPLPAQGPGTVQPLTDTAAVLPRQPQIDFQRWNDSTERDRLLDNIKRNGQSLDSFLASVREQKEKEKRNRYFRIGIGVLFFVALLVGWLKRKRRNS